MGNLNVTIKLSDLSVVSDRKLTPDEARSLIAQRVTDALSNDPFFPGAFVSRFTMEVDVTPAEQHAKSVPPRKLFKADLARARESLHKELDALLDRIEFDDRALSKQRLSATYHHDGSTLVDDRPRRTAALVIAVHPKDK